MSPIPPPPQPQESDRRTRAFGGLFDFEFNTFVIPTIVSILYIMLMVLALVFSTIGIIGGLYITIVQRDVSGLAAAVFTPLLALLFILFMRIPFELTMVVFNIAENLKVVRELEEARHP